MTCMRLKPTVKKHVNVLMHIMGHCKKNLSTGAKKELLAVLKSYKKHHIPLIVPIKLPSHYVRKYDEHYLEKQHYLNPNPTELKFRNHA